jgi:hypothetical protein
LSKGGIMSDELLDKATEVVAERQNKKQDLELRKFIEEKYTFENKKEVAFVLEYIKQGVAYKAYQKVFGEHINNNSAAVSAHRILKKGDFKISDFLDFSGNSITTMMEVLERLKDDDPKEYLKYTVKLHGLDQQKIEHSGSIQLPIINIITEKRD